MSSAKASLVIICQVMSILDMPYLSVVPCSCWLCSAKPSACACTATLALRSDTWCYTRPSTELTCFSHSSLCDQTPGKADFNQAAAQRVSSADCLYSKHMCAHAILVALTVIQLSGRSEEDGRIWSESSGDQSCRWRV